MVPRQEIEKLPLTQGGACGDQAVKEVLECIDSHSRFMPRDEAESNFDYVQIISCGVLTHEDRILLFRRKEIDPKSRLYGKTTIWQGCHVTNKEGTALPQLLKTALQDQVSRALFLSRVFPIEALGYCWDKDEELSCRHIGVFYRIDIDNPHTALDLKRKEFRKLRGYGFAGQFVDMQQLFEAEIDTSLESWSRAIRNCLGEKK